MHKTHKTETKQAALNRIADLCKWMISHGFIVGATKQPEPAEAAPSVRAEFLHRSTEDAITSTEYRAASMVEDNITFTEDKDANTQRKERDKGSTTSSGLSGHLQ